MPTKRQGPDLVSWSQTSMFGLRTLSPSPQTFSGCRETTSLKEHLNEIFNISAFSPELLTNGLKYFQFWVNILPSYSNFMFEKTPRGVWYTESIDAEPVRFKSLRFPGKNNWFWVQIKQFYKKLYKLTFFCICFLFLSNSIQVWAENNMTFWIMSSTHKMFSFLRICLIKFSLV